MKASVLVIIVGCCVIADSDRGYRTSREVRQGLLCTASLSPEGRDIVTNAWKRMIRNLCNGKDTEPSISKYICMRDNSQNECTIWSRRFSSDYLTEEGRRLVAEASQQVMDELCFVPDPEPTIFHEICSFNAEVGMLFETMAMSGPCLSCPLVDPVCFASCPV